MAFDISELSASISRYGIQRATHYSSLITLPSVLGSNTIASELPLRINSMNTPGTNFGTDEIKHKGFGLNEKRPVSVTFDDINLTIIADGQGRISNMLQQWVDLIFPSNIQTSDAENVEYFEYPNNYYGGLEIYIYDSTGNIHTTYNFVQPFLTHLGSIEMSWETTDTLLLLPVSFTFRSVIKNSNFSGQLNSNR